MPVASEDSPLVALVMGSKSDAPTLHHAAQTLAALAIPYEWKVVSAHRTPKKMFDFAQAAQARGIKVIIAAAGGAAHLPGMVASLTTLPVLGVPVESKVLLGQDSLLSIVQMPAGIPVGTLAIGKPGAINAALLAAAILALSNPEIAARYQAHRDQLTQNAASEKPEDGLIPQSPQ